ncbi:C2 domain [Trypanosoma vivax]|uniref:C2 domain-containing protein n=1 Tax=Trypanosoma vivax (strain Y486) TaxID=1055687 RepID=G0TU89_TRYVY|nr:hypothetical protein TRVL_05540 [Trypanosoma vivax]KAH8607425.1 C2 domain [Trypanosoma vivax]CCC47523.1 conserved hypothetical protein [Trypanosoma vivax Y486]
MQSGGVYDPDSLDNAQRVDELTELCNALKEQLATKELNEYEQEVRLRDLRLQLKELSSVEEKLVLANRNARVLEEENNSLIVKLKMGENTESGTSPVRVEALKLIEENNSLRAEIQELRSVVSKAQQKEFQLDQKFQSLYEQQERVESQIYALKKRNSELEEKLREEEHQWSVAKESWESERARSLQDYEELLASVKRFDGSTQQRDIFDGKDRLNDHSLQQALLKEDVAELEEKLRLTEERFRAKEREWWQVEANLRNEINALKDGKDCGEIDVYRAIQDQLDSFKQEVTTYVERKPACSFNKKSPFIDGSQVEDWDERVSELEAEIRLKEQQIDCLKAANNSSTNKNTVLTRENEQLQKEIDRLHFRNSCIEENASELEVRVKELEVLVASAEKKSLPSNRNTIVNETNVGECMDAEIKALHNENERLRTSLNHCNQQISALKAANEEHANANETLRSEHQSEVSKLILQNESLQQRLLQRSSRGEHGADSAYGNIDASCRENETRTRARCANDSNIFDRLLKNKMDSVEDLMRVLESAWSEEEGMRKQLKYLARRGQGGLSLLGNDPRLNEEILSHLRRLEHDERLQNNLMHPLRGRQSDGQEAEILRRLHDGIDGHKQPDTPREGGIDGRTKGSAESVAKPHNLTDGKEQKLQELNDQLRALRESNDGLWRQLVTLRDNGREAHGRNSGKKKSISPRRSARPRSVEPLAYCQPATQVAEEKRRNPVAVGAHLAVTVVELSDISRNGRSVTTPGYVVVKVKSMKEKYKTSVKQLAPTVRFNETFFFYLAQPDEDVITLHVFYKPKGSSREYHIGDASFTMATLYRGIPRRRIAVVAQNPGTRDARKAAQVEVVLQSDDFGVLTTPSTAEIEDENLRFKELLRRVEVSVPENLHCVDVLMAMNNS